jgi:uncharacterized protein (DUF58 family)
MDARLRELLKPEIINTMEGLELVARVIVEGYMSGSNKSQSIGIGQEFSQYRNYEPGDDLRQLASTRLEDVCAIRAIFRKAG